MAIALTTSQVIYAAQTKLLELADEVEQSGSFNRVKDQIRIGESLIRYIRVLQTDSTLTGDEQTAICQHMITQGDLYDFPGSPTITGNVIYSFSAGATVGPQGPQGLPGEDGGGTDYATSAMAASANVDTFAVTNSNGAEWSYLVKNGSNLRAGRVGACWLTDGSTVKSYEYSTMDIGDTSGITLSVVYSGGNISLYATVTSGTWEVQGTRYYIPNNGAGVEITTTALGSGQVFIGNSSNEMQARTVTGDVTFNNTGVTAITGNVIVDADVNSAAAIGLGKLASLTADRALVSSPLGVISVSTISTAKLNFLANVTSDLQTQLDSKLSGATGAISTVTSTDLSANKVLISNSAGKITASSISDTALGYISTLSSNAQTQLDAKLLKAGGTMTGALINTSTIEAQGGVRTASSGVYLKTIVVEIGDWDMDTFSDKNVTHSVTLDKIRSVNVIVRADVGSALENRRYNLISNGISTGIVGGYHVDGTSVVLSRTAGSIFDGPQFDATGFNRGWVTITYEA